MTPLGAVITGVGVISALGPDWDSLCRGLRAGSSGIKPLTLFDAAGYRSTWAGQAPDPAPPAELGSFDHCARENLLALHAAAEAVSRAGLSAQELTDAAVVLGTGSGGAFLVEQYQMRLLAEGEQHAPVSWLVSHQPANSADLVANRLGCGGPRCNLMTACSSSATALGLGLDMIRLGRARRVLAGGTEALCRLTFGGFSALRAMSAEPCRPFHRQRDGLTLGEGAAMLVLEHPDLARQRGARPVAQLAGYGVSADAHHLTAPAPDGRGARAAMAAALRNAGVQPQQVDYLNAHGTATPHNDAVEVAAILAELGQTATERLAVSSTKAITGHTLGAAGAVEAAVCCAAISEGCLPPTLGLDQVDPRCQGVDLVPLEPREATLDVVLSNSLAFGGNNTSLVLRRIA